MGSSRPAPSVSPVLDSAHLHRGARLPQHVNLFGSTTCTPSTLTDLFLWIQFSRSWVQIPYKLQRSNFRSFFIVAGCNKMASCSFAQSDANIVGQVSESQFTTAPICLVLTEDVQKIFAQGDPLIVGTTMGDIQTFFQKVISEAQIGIEQNAQRAYEAEIDRWTQGARNGKTVDIGNYSAKPERYPVPRAPNRSRSKKDKTGEEEDEQADRCEIPLDAVRLYLSEQKYFPGWTSNSKRNLRKRCDDFKLENDLLMYRTRKGTFVQCVEDRAERMRLLWSQHSIDHKRRDRLFHTLKEKYYWKGMLYDINKMLAACEYCAKLRGDKTLAAPERNLTSKKPRTEKPKKSGNWKDQKGTKIQTTMSPLDGLDVPVLVNQTVKPS